MTIRILWMIFAVLGLSSCKVIGNYELQKMPIKETSEPMRIPVLVESYDQIELEFGGTVVYNQWYHSAGGCCSPSRSHVQEQVGYWKKRGDTLMLEFRSGEWQHYLVSAEGDSLKPIAGNSRVYVKK